jgi:hypothetical protein
MQTTEIIAQLDAEIARLQQVKTLLTGTIAKRGPGRSAVIEVWSEQFEAVQGDFTRCWRNGGKIVHTHEYAK